MQQDALHVGSCVHAIKAAFQCPRCVSPVRPTVPCPAWAVPRLAMHQVAPSRLPTGLHDTANGLDLRRAFVHRQAPTRCSQWTRRTGWGCDVLKMPIRFSQSMAYIAAVPFVCKPITSWGLITVQAGTTLGCCWASTRVPLCPRVARWAGCRRAPCLVALERPGSAPSHACLQHRKTLHVCKVRQSPTPPEPRPAHLCMPASILPAYLQAQHQHHRHRRPSEAGRSKPAWPGPAIITLPILHTIRASRRHRLPYTMSSMSTHTAATLPRRFRTPRHLTCSRLLPWVPPPPPAPLPNCLVPRVPPPLTAPARWWCRPWRCTAGCPPQAQTAA